MIGASHRNAIRIRAKSLSGSVHIVIGRVERREPAPYRSVTEARDHLTRNGWQVLNVL